MLSEEEKQKIRDLYNQLKSLRKVAEKTKYSYVTVFRVINNRTKSNENIKTKIGRPKAISNKEMTRIKKFVRQEIAQNHIVNIIIIYCHLRNGGRPLSLAASRPTIRRELNKLGFDYNKIQKSLPLTKIHKENRMRFCEENLANKTDFNLVIFSDEKRFSMDGPDSMFSYFENKNKRKVGPSRIKRQAGGGGVMILGAISSKGNLKIKVIEGRYSASTYLEDLKDCFIPWCKSEFPRKKWIWQQDNASIHTASIINSYFIERNINILKWPARSPDLNIIENIWHLLELKIYENRQYNSKKELIDAILKASIEIKAKTIINLFESIPNRLIKLIKCKGNEINY